MPSLVNFEAMSGGSQGHLKQANIAAKRPRNVPRSTCQHPWALEKGQRPDLGRGDSATLGLPSQGLQALPSRQAAEEGEAGTRERAPRLAHPSSPDNAPPAALTEDQNVLAGR